MRQAEARAKMLEAARNAFESDGFDGATMRQIAEASNVAVGTLFNYFPDKPALLREALRSDLEGIIADLDLRGAATLPELFVETARPFLTHYCSRPALSLVLLRATLFAPDSATFRDQAERVGALLVARVTELKAAGRLRSSANPQAITLAFFSHYYFVLMSQLATADLATMLRQLELLGTQLETGVGA